MSGSGAWMVGLRVDEEDDGTKGEVGCVMGARCLVGPEGQVRSMACVLASADARRAGQRRETPHQGLGVV